MYKRDFEARSGFKTHLARQTMELTEEEKKKAGQAASVQRSAASPNHSLLKLQRQYGNRYVQRVVTLARATEGEGDVMPDLERAIESSRSGGRSLDSGVQAQMGQALNADFSGVRVHTDAGADGLNRSLSAKAFTTGRDIYFRQGEYNPGSSDGRELLAHELTHVVQQNPDKIQTKSDDEGSQAGCTCGTSATGGPQMKLTVSQPGDQYEQEADRIANAVMHQEQGNTQSSQGESDAIQMNRSVGAQAFTHGPDIYFGAGNGPNDLALAAHELMHVVQQTGGAPLQTKRGNETTSSGNTNLAIQRTCAACGVRVEDQRRWVDHNVSTPFVERRIGDGHDLTSPRFSGDAVLEACFDNERLLTVGARGDAVLKLQQALVDAGFPLPKFGVDGEFGSETRTAVRNYQRAHGLSPDGIVGPLTMGALDAQFAGGPPGPAPAPPGPAPAPPGPAPAPPGPAPAPPGPAPAPPGPAPAPPGPAPAPPGPAPAPPGPAPAPPGPAPAPPETIASQTVALTPGARTRTKIGVGEEVTLTHAPGAAAWSAPLGKFSVANGPTTIFTAPDTAQARLTVTGGTATKDFEVVAPTSVAMDREPGTGVMHALNRPTSGIRTRVFLGPDTVNFNKVIYHEMDVAGVATAGVYSCNPFSGGHCGAGGGGVACPDKDMTDTVAAGQGTQSRRGDCATSGDCCGTPLAAGSVSLSIPYEYKIGAGAFHPITNVPQVHALAADLTTLTTDKAGAHGDTTVAAVSVAVAGCVLNSCP